jgi:hypothetical protein
MATTNYFKLLMLLFIPAFIAGAATVIYLPIYKKKINSRLSQFGEKAADMKPITTPGKYFLIFCLFTVAAMALGMIIFYNAANSKKRTTLEAVDEVEFFMNARDYPTLLDKYEPGEELPGYDLNHIQKENDIEIYFYASREPGYFGFPDGLIGIVYTGSDEQYLGLDAEYSQTGVSRLGDFAGSNQFRTYEVPLKWFTFDIMNFFGELDIKVRTMKKAESPFDNDDELFTGKTAELHVKLDEEYHIENWFDE